MAQEFKYSEFAEALSFLNEVKLAFSDQPVLFNHFVDILTNFKKGRIPMIYVIKHAINLFRGHPELFAGFCEFVPESEKAWIRNYLQEKENAKARNVGSAIIPGRLPDAVPGCPPRDYKEDHISSSEVQLRENEVHRAADQPKENLDFLHIRRNLNLRGNESPDAIKETGDLSPEHPDLIGNFNKFLPSEVQPNKRIEVILPQRDSGGDIITDSITVHDRPNITIYLPHNFPSNNFSREHPHSMPEYSVKYVYDSQIPDPDPDHEQCDEDKLLCLELVESTFGKQVFHKFLSIITELGYHSNHVLGHIYRVLRLFQGHLSLIGNFNAFLPSGYRVEVRTNEHTNITAENSGIREASYNMDVDSSSHVSSCDSLPKNNHNADAKK